MGKNRPIVVATLGYIIGIIWGLYLKINIVSFYIIILTISTVAKIIPKKQYKRKFKFISIQKIFRYIKLILDFKSLIIIILFSSISNFTVIHLNDKYENLYASLEEVNIIATVVDNGTDKEYKTMYKIKVEEVNGKSKYKGTYLYLDVNKKIKTSLKYGDYIQLQGTYIKPSSATNYQGFDYSKYLRTLKIYGTVKLEKVNILKENSNNKLFTISNNVFIKIKQFVQQNLSEQNANLLLGILLGYKTEIPEEMQDDFKQSNISHILAVSGLHVSYIILAVTTLFEKLQGKRKAKLLTIFFIIIYMFMTNFSPSVVRASLMGIITLLAKLTHNKNDIWTNISISILCILIYNPHLITSVGVLLSYGGTIGIIIFQKSISHILQNIKLKSKTYKYKAGKSITKIIDYIQDTISVSFSAQIVIAPIMAKMFNTTSLSFFITNFFVSLIIGPIIILGLIFIIFKSNIIKFILENLLNLLILISKSGKFLPFNQIYLATPYMWQILVFYILAFILNIIYKISTKRKITTFEKRLINWKNLLKHLARKNCKKIIGFIICIIMLILVIKITPNDLKIYFIDVGQGESTLIITPQGKSILIDGGGSENYDIGKNTLLPYLLDRKITKIDYMIISHFDTDHVLGLFPILEELKVEKVIIGKQYESSENLKQLLNIIKEKKILVKQVTSGDKINIEKNLYITVLFPTSKLIKENSINNNALVFKLIYNDFSMLFTGDIEELAEEQIVKMYEKNKVLSSTVLKVAHHGSKSSSTEKFLKLVQPKIALIGVGKNNLYGHPNSEVLYRLTKLRSKNL